MWTKPKAHLKKLELSISIIMLKYNCLNHDRVDPAAIYLGGSGQTVVRAIDSQVIDLFNRAEVSANGGDDNLGGGIITIRPPVIAPPPAPASLKVIIAPAGAIAAGARWNVGGAACASGASISLPAGTYTLTCTGASGFLAPASSTITLSSGQGCLLYTSDAADE